MALKKTLAWTHENGTFRTAPIEGRSATIALQILPGEEEGNYDLGYQRHQVWDGIRVQTWESFAHNVTLPGCFAADHWLAAVLDFEEANDE